MKSDQKFKIFLNKLNENWIVDRLRKEYISNNKEHITNFQSKSDIIWMIAPWTWKQINRQNLKNKITVCTIHHIDEKKFQDEKELFYIRDQFVNFYHCPSQKSTEQLRKLTDKKIYTLPFWIDATKWFNISSVSNLQQKYKINSDEFLIGSFQRDSEGHDPNLPKLSKGPDRFIEIVKHYKSIKPKVAVVLTGTRRNYVINELEKNNIKYYYFKMVTENSINELYNILDLYLVTSRYEGGPFSIYESAITKTPIISTDVGIAKEILSEKSIYDFENFQKARTDINTAFNNVNKYTMENTFPNYKSMFQEIYES